jgi:hypothetical protein
MKGFSKPERAGYAGTGRSPVATVRIKTAKTRQAIIQI